TKVEFIACPSCGRTKFNLPTVLNQVKDATSHLVGLDIAVMGCFPGGEKVVTEEGFWPIDAVGEGQRVLTHEGKFAAVTATQTHHFNGDVVEIKARGAPAVRMTGNHPILAMSRNGRLKNGRTRWENMAGIPANGHTPRWHAAEEITRDSVLMYPII